MKHLRILTIFIIIIGAIMSIYRINYSSIVLTLGSVIGIYLGYMNRKE